MEVEKHLHASFLRLGAKLLDESDHVRRSRLGLLQWQKMGGPRDIDQRRPRTQLFLKLHAVFRRRDLILSPLQD